MCAPSNSRLNIFRACSVREIFQSRIQSIIIFVTNIMTYRARTKKGFGNHNVQ